MMNNFFSMLLLLSLILFVVVDAGFQRCEEISVISSNYNYLDSDDKSNISFSVILHISRSNNQNVITIKKFTEGNSTQKSYDITKQGNVASKTNFKLCVDDECFNNNLNDSVIVDDSIISITAWDPLNPDEDGYLIFWGSINDANFIFYDGRMFSDENKCLSYSDIDKELLFGYPSLIIETCCTSFQPVTIVPANTSKCTKFSIASTLFNITENTIVANTNADFELSENDIIGKGKFSINYSPFEMAYFYAINSLACQWSSTNIQYCHYPINGQDRILWFYVRQYPTIYPLALAGKLIIRDGQTLSAEGIPFSSTNKCQNFTEPLTINEPYGGEPLNWTVNVLSQFCCSSFDAPIPPSPFPLSNITEQKCNSVQTSSTLETLNLNMSATLDVTSINDTTNFVTINNFQINTTLDMSKFEFCTYEFILGKKNCRPISTSMNFTNIHNSPLQLLVDTHLTDGDRETYTPPLFYGMIDHGNFISCDGSLFDINKQKCSNFNDNTLSITSCCGAYNQAISEHPNIPPRCTNFHAVSTLHNTSDNSLYATASANFMLTGMDLIGIGEFSDASVPVYSINAFQFEFGVNGTQFGGFPINSNSSEFLIHLSYYSLDSNYDQIFVGRIILFNGQTFMDQNIPFSPSNVCYNFTAPYYDSDYNDGINVVSQLCCTNFGDSSASTTPASQSTTYLFHEVLTVYLPTSH